MTWSLFFHEKCYRRRTDAAITPTLNQPDVYRLALVLSPIPICVALHSGKSPQSDRTCISNQPLSHNNNNKKKKNAREEISHMPGSWLLSVFGATQPYDLHYTESFKWPLRCYLQKANMAAISPPPPPFQGCQKISDFAKMRSRCICKFTFSRSNVASRIWEIMVLQ